MTYTIILLDFITDGTGITIDSNDSGNIITITRDPLTVADIPELSTDKITSGEFDSARLALGGATGYVLTKTDDGQSWQPISVGGVTEEQVYGHSTNIITEGSGISVDLNESDNTITISVTNEFTSAHETKLDGIETGAEVNVQSNWAEADGRFRCIHTEQTYYNRSSTSRLERNKYHRLEFYTKQTISILW